MINTIVRAGHRWIGLGYLILAEDGASAACDDPQLPRDVLRISVLGGRQIDLRGGPADEMRRTLEETSYVPGAEFAHGRRVESAGPVQPGRRGRRRRAE